VTERIASTEATEIERRKLQARIKALEADAQRARKTRNKKTGTDKLYAVDNRLMGDPFPKLRTDPFTPLHFTR